MGNWTTCQGHNKHQNGMRKAYHTEQNPEKQVSLSSRQSLEISWGASSNDFLTFCQWLLQGLNTTWLHRLGKTRAQLSVGICNDAHLTGGKASLEWGVERNAMCGLGSLSTWTAKWALWNILSAGHCKVVSKSHCPGEQHLTRCPGWSKLMWTTYWYPRFFILYNELLGRMNTPTTWESCWTHGKITCEVAVSKRYGINIAWKSTNVADFHHDSRWTGLSHPGCTNVSFAGAPVWGPVIF